MSVRGRGVLRAQAHSFKKAWRRVLSNGLLEQIMVSLAACCVNSSDSSDSRVGGARAAGHYLRLQSAPPDEIVTSSCSGRTNDHGGDNDTVSEQPHVNGQSADNTIVLKVSILGDPETGKTSFMAKYVCSDQLRPESVETMGVATVEKVLHVQNTDITFSIWDLGGHWQCDSMLPMMCRDAAAILIMFDLTRRSTLNSVKDWFVQARECNKAAIAVIVGTKYDHFVELPQDIQRAIIQQARVSARAMGASLFFSSVTHNINVHKVFKVIVAKLFDLPCTIPTNLNFGEPIVDY